MAKAALDPSPSQTDGARRRAKQSARPEARRLNAVLSLWPFVARYRWLAIAALVTLVFTAALSLLLPLVVRRVVDGFDAEALAGLNREFALALFIVALLALGTGLRYYLVTRLGERVVADLRLALFSRLIGLSPAFYERILTGEVLSRLTTDTTLIQTIVGSSASLALRNVLMLIGGLILLAVTAPKLTALVLGVVPAVIVPIVLLGRRLRRLSRENQDWIAESSGRASEELLAAQTVQAFTHEQASIAAFARVTEKTYSVALARVATRAALTVIIIFLVAAGVLAVLWVGARDVIAGAMSPGQLVQFVIFAVLVAGAVGALTEVWGELQRAAGAAERLAELLRAEDPVPDPPAPRPLRQPVKGEIRFEGVRFSYPTRPNRSALDGIDLHLRPGETVALVGPSGAGKSTILQLILRFYDPLAGRILIDGIDLRELAKAELRRAIAFVPQEPVIFAASAAENIRFGRPEATDAEVEAAARAAAAHEFIAGLPEGYNTQLGERGVLLSGGQKQRIALARAILRDAPILLLDEATAALDAESERAVQAAVERLAKGRTTLIVAHRLATVRRADRIVVFDRGRIVAEGTHAALVAEGGLYARLARLQFMTGTADESVAQ